MYLQTVGIIIGIIIFLLIIELSLKRCEAKIAFHEILRRPKTILRFFREGEKYTSGELARKILATTSGDVHPENKSLHDALEGLVKSGDLQSEKPHITIEWSCNMGIYDDLYFIPEKREQRHTGKVEPSKMPTSNR